MSTPSTIIVIPARYASTRFPGKPLVDMLGKPMIQRVVEQAAHCPVRIVVATDDQRIYDCVAAFGAEVIMTSPDHLSGTARCIEAYERVGRGEELLLNLQGDEPFVQPQQIETLLRAFDRDETQIATLAEAFDPNTPDEILADPNVVKLVRGLSGQALYFSRSVVPYLRGYSTNLCQHHRYYKHIGLYAFRTEILPSLKTLPPSTLELAESLEQLRWLSAGYHIQVEETQLSTIGIDTPADLERACQYLRQQLDQSSR